MHPTPRYTMTQQQQRTVAIQTVQCARQQCVFCSSCHRTLNLTPTHRMALSTHWSVRQPAMSSPRTPSARTT